MSAARCPRCATPTLVPGHGVYVCTGCGGAWLDAAQAHQLLAPLGGDVQPSATPQTAAVACPVCGNGMYICLTRYAGVEFDVCGPHGVWFDRHELERVSHAVSHLTGRPAPHAPRGWVQAQPPPGHAVGHGGYGPGLVAGAAVVGVAAAGAAAAGVATYAAMGGAEELEQRTSSVATDALSAAPDVVSAGFDVAAAAEPAGEVAGEVAGGAAELAGGAVEVAGEVAGGAAEAAGSILGSIFEAIGGIFS